MKIDKKFIEMADGTSIYYEVSGVGPLLVFLHGNGGSSTYFAGQQNFFSSSYRVLLIDSRDHGRSDNAANVLTLAQMAEDVFTVIQKERERGEKINLVGFSDGANIAMVFASKHPEFIQTLILNSGNYTTKGIKKISFLFSRFSYQVVNFLSHFFIHLKKWQRRISLIVEEPAVSLADLHKITAPTLVLVGEMDLIYREHSQQIQQAIPKAVLKVVVKGRHDLVGGKAKEYTKIISTFLNENRKGVHQ